MTSFLNHNKCRLPYINLVKILFTVKKVKVHADPYNVEYVKFPVFCS